MRIDRGCREAHRGGVAECLQEIQTFLLGKRGLTAGQGPGCFIGPKLNVDFAQARRFLQETAIGGTELIKGGGDDDASHGFGQVTRTWMRKDPGTGSAEMTVR